MRDTLLRRNEEFRIIERGDVTETVETQPYGRHYTMRVHHFERTVTVLRTLVCEACGGEFSYKVTARLQWTKSYHRDILESDALDRLYARERRRITNPNPDHPIICPHCHAAQGVHDGAESLLARAVDGIKRILSFRESS